MRLRDLFKRPQPAPLALPRMPDPEPPRKGWRASAMQAAAMASDGRAEPANPFTPYAAPKWVKGASKQPAMAMDDASSFQAVLDTSFFGSAYLEGQVFLGYQMLAVMSQRPEYRRPVTILADELTRKGFRLSATGDEDKGDRIAELIKAVEKYKLVDKLREAIELDGFFGRAHIVPDLGVNDPSELMTPMVMAPAKVKKGSLKGFRVVEPTWTYPGSDYSTTDPLRPDFYRPQSWLFVSTQIHSSRMATLISAEVPDILKPAYNFGGLPLTQQLKPYVDNWLRTRQSVSDLLDSFTTWVLKSKLDVLTNPAPGDADLVTRAQLFNQYRDNRGIFLLDKDEEFANVSAPLGSLDKLQAQSQEHMAAVPGIPLIHMFGITPTGLNASSDSEIQVFHERLESTQKKLNHLVKFCLDVIQLSEFGEVDPAIVHVWEPMRHLSEAEMAGVRKTEADTDAVLIDCGVIDPSESRKRLGADVDGPYPGLDPDDLPEPPEPQADPNASPDEPNPAADPNPTQDDTK